MQKILNTAQPSSITRSRWRIRFINYQTAKFTKISDKLSEINLFRDRALFTTWFCLFCSKYTYKPLKIRVNSFLHRGFDPCCSNHNIKLSLEYSGNSYYFTILLGTPMLMCWRLRPLWPLMHPKGWPNISTRSILNKIIFRAFTFW